MDISQFTTMMQHRKAQQIIIAPDAPLQFFSDGKWQQTTLITPNVSTINRMMKECVPVHLQNNLQQNDNTFAFPYQTALGTYDIEVKSVSGVRTITLTDSAAPPPDASTRLLPPVVSSSAAAFSAGASSSLNPPPLKAASQMAREMSKGNVNILTPPPVPAEKETPTPMTPAPQPVAAAPHAASPTNFRATPNTLTTLWYHAASGQQVGPVEQVNMEQCIASNIVRPETMVWRDGMPDWTMAKLTELSPLLPTQPPPMSGSTITDHAAATGFGLYGGLNSSGQSDDVAAPTQRPQTSRDTEPYVVQLTGAGAVLGCAVGFYVITQFLPENSGSGLILFVLTSAIAAGIVIGVILGQYLDQPK